jgi:hypothetical protein
VLFLFSTLAFVYYYHCYLAGVAAPGISYRSTEKTGATTGEAGTAGISVTAETTGATIADDAYGGQGHQMLSLPKKATNAGPATNENVSTTNVRHNEIPYPTTGVRSTHDGGFG